MAAQSRSVDEIADRERVGVRCLRRVLSLAFLAPKILEAIAAGNHRI